MNIAFKYFNGGLFVSFILSITISIATHATPSTAQEQETWEQVIKKVISEGEFYNFQYLDYLVLEVTNPKDKNLDHQSKYFSAVGGYDQDRVFHVVHTELLLEDWTTNRDGNWDVQRWTLKISRNGELLDFSRNYLIETKEKRVLDSGRIPFTKVEAEEKLEELMSFWIEHSKNPDESQPSAPEPSDSDKWMNLIGKAISEGKKTNTNIGIFHSLADQNPIDNNESHVAKYFSAVGTYDNDGTPLIDRIDMVTETWVKTAEGGWMVDQWTFKGSSTGELEIGRHNQFELDKDRFRKSWNDLEEPHEVLQSKWNDLKNYWVNSAKAETQE